MKYFKLSEFACPCCGKGGTEMNLKLLVMLDEAREIAGVPFVITSGYRCLGHHTDIYKKLGHPVLKDSPHLIGVAADISAEGAARWNILNGLVRAGFKRIGIGKDFFHVDVDERKIKAFPCVWIY